MWGKGFSAFSTCLSSGITPTHVGKRVKVGEILNFDEDHPHPCGEKNLPFREFQYSLGSPPPMWGKVQVLGKSKV